MKKTLFAVLVMLLVLSMTVFAEDAAFFGFGGVTDGYIIAGEDGGKLTAGQDVNLDFGPVYFDVTADWTKTLWGGGDVLALAYTLGFSRAFGIFTPKVELTGDKSYDFPTKVLTGDLFSDLMPSLNIAFGKVGADIYSDLSFEEGYEIFQTADVSAYANLGPAAFRVGFLYMDPVAVVDDVGYPFAPAAREGYSLYAKASVSY